MAVQDRTRWNSKIIKRSILFSLTVWLLWTAQALTQLKTSSTFYTTRFQPSCSTTLKHTSFDHEKKCDSESDKPVFDMSRRQIVAAVMASQTLLWSTAPADAAASFLAKFLEPSSSLYVVSPRLKNATTTATSVKNQEALQYLSCELALLNLLPVRNDRKSAFRALQGRLEGIAFALAAGRASDASAWTRSTLSMNESISFLDKQRDQLVPVFNQEDSTMLAINKAEQGEVRIEALRGLLVEIMQACGKANATLTFQKQKQALMALAQVGELLVSTYPYDVPSEGKFSYLPRLLGRARVTLTFRRKDKLLGNITILADGYMAPITAGNFVDLAARNFYTGLPIRLAKKRVQEGFEFDVANLPILGDFNEGFYDPLTAKLRRIPLEMIRVEKSNNVPYLSYAQGLSSLTTTVGSLGRPLVPSSNLEISNGTNFDGAGSSHSGNTTSHGGGLGGSSADRHGINNNNSTRTISTTRSKGASTVNIQPTSLSKPLLSFTIPGLVAMNHPDKNPNGGSSEFFCLQQSSMIEERRKLLDGEYAPFGFIVQGLDLYNQLQANDVIDSTTVDESGLLNLVKLRQSKFSEVVQGKEAEEESAEKSE